MANMREEMPLCAEWIDALREVFGRDVVDAGMRQGLKDGTCWFREGTASVGSFGAEVISVTRSAWFGVSGEALILASVEPKLQRRSA
jgi:hypothetical protein